MYMFLQVEVNRGNISFKLFLLSSQIQFTFNVQTLSRRKYFYHVCESLIFTHGMSEVSDSCSVCFMTDNGTYRIVEN